MQEKVLNEYKYGIWTKLQFQLNGGMKQDKGTEHKKQQHLCHITVQLVITTYYKTNRI